MFWSPSLLLVLTTCSSWHSCTENAFHVLQDDFRSAGRSSSNKPQQQRMTDYLKFAEQLGAVSSTWRLDSSSTLRQVSAHGHTSPDIWPLTLQASRSLLAKARLTVCNYADCAIRAFRPGGKLAPEGCCCCKSSATGHSVSEATYI